MNILFAVINNFVSKFIKCSLFVIYNYSECLVHQLSLGKPQKKRPFCSGPATPSSIVAAYFGGIIF